MEAVFCLKFWIIIIPFPRVWIFQDVLADIVSIHFPRG